MENQEKETPIQKDKFTEFYHNEEQKAKETSAPKMDNPPPPPITLATKAADVIDSFLTDIDNAATPQAYPKETMDGFAFLDETDEAMEIESKTYDNGSMALRTVLRGGVVAIARELTGHETEVHVGRFTANMKAEEAKDAAIPIIISLGTTFNGEKIIMEDVKLFKLKDYTRLKLMHARLNF